MTKDDAIRYLAGVAAQWAENQEEGFPGRISPYDTDDVLADKVEDSDYTVDDAKLIRDVWIAIDVLHDIINAQPRLVVTDASVLPSLISDLEGRWENARDDEDEAACTAMQQALDFLGILNAAGTFKIPTTEAARQIAVTIENSLDDEVDLAAGVKVEGAA